MTIVMPQKERALCLKGGPHAGKTASLVAHAQELLQGGTEPKSIRIICGAPASIPLFQAALPEIAVSTAQDFALSILAFTKQRHRLLCPYEEQMLFEDLRTTGLPQKQLRAVLDFLFASIAACKDWEDGWIEMCEERLVYETLMANLAFIEGVCAPEVANLAAVQLRDNSDAQKAFSVAHVLVDDYGLLSRSAQILCGLAAQQSLTAAAQPRLCLAASERYPNPQGIDEFMAFYPNAEEELLSGSAPQVPKQRVSYPSVKEEFSGIVQVAKSSLATHRSMAVVGTNAQWRANMRAALQHAGLSTTSPEKVLRARAFDDENTCTLLAADALGKLARNPADGVALRCLYGLGDYLAHSAELKRLREENPHKTLAQLHMEIPLKFVEENMARYAPAATLDEERDTSALCTAATDGAQLIDPQKLAAEQTIYVCAPEDLFGYSFDVVVFGGYLQGWVPQLAYFNAVGAHKEKLFQDALLKRDCAQHSAKKEIYLTSFDECPLEFAEALGLHYGHIRLKHGVRVCELLPFEE